MEGEVEDEDLIQREDVVVTVSHRGYIKRVPLSTYRAQRRGGKGRSGMATREEDVVTQIFVASTHTPVLFFSSRGMVYRMKVWRLPAATPQSVGKALVNLLPLAEGEVITSILPLPEDQSTWGTLQLMFATAHRQRAPQQPRRLREHQSQRQDRHEARRGRPHRARGDLPTGDRAEGASDPCREVRRDAPTMPRHLAEAEAEPGPVLDNVLLTTAPAAASASPWRTCVCSRAATPSACAASGSTRATRSSPWPSCATSRRRRASAPPTSSRRWPCAARREPRSPKGRAEPEAEAEEGAEARRAEPERYAELGGQGAVRAHGVGARLRQALLLLRVPHLRPRRQRHHRHDRQRAQRPLVASFPVEDSDQIMLVTDAGKLIRCPVDDVRIAGRNTQGVRIFKTDEDEKVVSVERIPEDGQRRTPRTAMARPASVGAR